MSTPRAQSRANPSVLKIYLAASILCALISAGAYFIGVRPALARHAEQKGAEVDLKAARQKSSDLAAARNHALGELAAVNDTLNSLTLRLEPMSTVNQRLAKLTELATKDCVLTIDEMRAGAVIEGPDYQTVSILIAGNGTYQACAKFLHTLRKTYPDTAVRSFETTNNSASPDSPAATFQFDLVWHAAKG